MSNGSKNRRNKLSSAASALENVPQSGASSNDTKLSKIEPDATQTALQEKAKDAIVSDNDFFVEVDASTNKVSVSRPLFGKNKDLTNALGNQVACVLLNAEGKRDVQNVKWAFAAINGIGPKDELEALLAVQMIGVHSFAMECLKRASQEGQTTYGVDANVNRATKLLRTFTTQLEALNRHRGKIGQPMVVGNVNVNEGGQAIVGSVSTNGRNKASTEDDADKVK
jgi:hypothetical protein